MKKEKIVRDCSMCVFGGNLAEYLGYSSLNTYIPGCLKKGRWFFRVRSPKNCDKFIQKGGRRL